MVKRLRKTIQTGFAILSNAYVQGFMPGGPALYSGPLKRLCVPGLNCYSCPGALGACPIGSLQAALNQRHRRFPFYVGGYLALIGLILGRFVCGWLCLFGLVQELLYKIPVKKIEIPAKIDKPLRYLKYVVLAVLAIGLPLIYRSEYGAGVPFFCKYLCPVGTLEGGIPQVLLNDALRPALGWLFSWKMTILILCLVACVFIYRPFCKYLCPLGAFYAMFQKAGLIRMKADRDACIGCGACSKVCGMKVDPLKDPNSGECIRCGDCVNVCPVKALKFTCLDREINIRKKEVVQHEE